MSRSIIEQIAEAVAGVVDTVTVANGYSQDLSALRPRRNDWADIAPVDGRVLVWQDDDEPLDASAITTTEFAQAFSLICMVLDGDAADTSIDTRLNAVKSDLRKAFAADHTLGGLALDVVPGGSSKFDDGQGFTGITVTFVVRYRTAEDDPYTQA
jgi:hypothetical protein